MQRSEGRWGAAEVIPSSPGTSVAPATNQRIEGAGAQGVQGASMSRQLALVIEDSDDTRELYALALQLDGYVVAQARDGRDGLQQARDLVPDVIITDLAMPIM